MFTLAQWFQYLFSKTDLLLSLQFWDRKYSDSSIFPFKKLMNKI